MKKKLKMMMRKKYWRIRLSNSTPSSSLRVKRNVKYQLKGKRTHSKLLQRDGVHEVYKGCALDESNLSQLIWLYGKICKYVAAT